MRSLRVWIGTAAVLAAGIGVLRAGDNDAHLPYELIYKIQQAQTRLAKTYTNLDFKVGLRSSLTNVAIVDLDVYVQTKTGKYPVPLGRKGDFSVPSRPDWVEEKAAIVVNQPSGTMILDWEYDLHGTRLSTNQMPYLDLMLGVKDFPILQAELAKEFPGFPAKAVEGLSLVFPKGSVAEVSLKLAAGEKVLKPSADNTVVVPLDAALVKENPQVRLSSTPEAGHIQYKTSAK